MKIDKSKIKKSSSEVPADCKALIERLKACSEEELLAEFKKIETWTFGKCELYHWIDVLDICDSILEKAARREHEGSWVLACDLPHNKQLKELLLWTLHFTTLLIEHSFSRHLYSSMEHLTSLLAASCLNVVLAVLNLLYMFSKRSNFISRLPVDRRQALLARLTHLAESWGGKENGFGLGDCCKDLPLSLYPASATTLHFEFYTDESGSLSISKSKTPTTSSASVVTVIHINRVDQQYPTAAACMEDCLRQYAVPADKQMQLFTHVRLAHAFSDYRRRLQCVQARLQALSVLIYSNALADSVHTLLYAGLLEELVELLELNLPQLMEIRAAALRTLTSIIHLDRNPNFPKLNTIIDVTGASSYHGFLPVLVRTCIASLTGQNAIGNVQHGQELPSFPLPLATALFSFLYHLASYEAGGEALVSCGMMESLLRVINWPGSDLEHITFVTRAVRVIDLITNLDMHAFQSHGGLQSFINRLEVEVNACRLEQPFEIRPANMPRENRDDSLPIPSPGGAAEASPMEIEGEALNLTTAPCQPGTSTQESGPGITEPIPGVTCLPQRAALLKSMLNFLKKAIQDPAFADSIRHVMDGPLPSALKHMISNAEYYGPSLFLLATDVVTVYVFQEPSLLSSLQDNGLTDVVLHALLVKEVPATREVLGSLPNVFSALCLNTRGLAAFVACRPFERLFKVLLSPDYLPAMRRRRSADPMGDTAANLGNAMDELMRHQPSLRTNATAAIIRLLEELCAMGHDPSYVAWKPQIKGDEAGSLPVRTSGAENGAGGSSDEEEEEEEESSASQVQRGEEAAEAVPSPQEKTPVPLVDYVLNVMKFVDAILSNNSTDDHCREFVSQKGLVPLLGILGLPNLPIDFPISPACQAVASVCKSILNLAHEQQVLKQGLTQLSEVLAVLQDLHQPLDSPGGSVLLRELASAPNPAEAISSPSATPLLHAMSAAHAYIVMFVYVCRTGQSDIRTLSVNHWGSPLGLAVLAGLSKLYTSLVWESTVLLALCAEDALPIGSEFGKVDMEKLLPKSDEAMLSSTQEVAGPSKAVEAMDTENGDSKDKESKEKKVNPALQHQIKQIKPLLSGASRLGRALAELFGLLVKLCVGSPLRHRRAHQAPATPAMPSPPAQAVAGALTQLLSQGLAWKPPSTAPSPKFRLTFFICSVGFTSSMLFDEKKFPYHLMLHKFVSCRGLTAFFESFKWALSCDGTVPLEQGLENPNIPEGTGEFLDAWLMLLEKLVNPRAVLESPHTMPSKSLQLGYVPFSPLNYLIQVHKLAFEAVMFLWGKKPLKVYGGRMAESMLAILCHILKGETLIQEKLSQEKTSAEATLSSALASAASVSAPGAVSSSVPTPTARRTAAGAASTSTGSTTERAPAPVPAVEEPELQALMDMGFPRQRCIEALMFTTNLEQATDYLLTSGGAGPVGDQGMGVDVDSMEDNAMLRAINMSLGSGAAGSEETNVSLPLSLSITNPFPTDTAPPPAAAEDKNKPSPLEGQVIDQFSQQALGGCLTLMDTLPDTVYRVCDLLAALVARNGLAFKKDLIHSLAQEVDKSLGALTTLNETIVKEGVGKEKDKILGLVNSSTASQAAVRIHLFTLMFEFALQEMKVACAQEVETLELPRQLVTLLTQAEQILNACCQSRLFEPDPPPTPKWLAPLLLLLDLFEKVSVGAERRAVMARVTAHTWKWFDIVSGKWCLYTAVNNKVIDDAFWAGESSVRVSAGRRRYVLQFTAMIQINEETGNRRPIMLALKDRVADEEKDKMEVDDAEKDTKWPTFSGLGSNVSNIIRACVGLLAVPVDPDSLHAALRLCLRITRVHSQAELLASLNGVKLILGLSQASAFSGFLSLATLLLRHLIEEPSTLRHTMEKVIRSSTSSNSAPSTKEFHFLMRVLAPAACRDPELFSQVSRDMLRVDLALTHKRGDEEDSRLLMKTLPSKSGPLPTLSTTAQAVLSDLLDALTIPVPQEETSSETVSVTSSVIAPPTPSHATTSGARRTSRNVVPTAPPGPIQPPRAHDVIRNSSSSDLLQHENEDASESDHLRGSTKDGGAGKKRDAKEEEMERRKRPLVPKSAICRLLAEMVRSYAGCAKLVAEYTYPAMVSPLVTEDCSALGFILDNLLPPCQSAGDKDSPNMARMLVASLASCNHSPEAQTALVSEVKAALSRALVLGESTEKHTRIQALTALLSTMIDSCPSTTAQPLTTAFKQQHLSMNNMVRLMIRRGLVTDLARIPHALDLSSPHMAATVNSALKPLEALSRIVNLPPALPPSRGTTKSKNGEGSENAPQPGTSTSDTTRAQAHEPNELDTENTEHDVSVADPVSTDVEPVGLDHETDEAGLEEIMDQLLERDGNTNEPRSAIVALIDADETGVLMETDDTMHDSAMRTRHESDYGGDDTQDEDDGQDSSDSDSDRSDNEDDEEVDEEEEEDNDEDVEEEEVEEEEEEDENEDGGDDAGSTYEEQDGLQDVEDTLFRNFMARETGTGAGTPATAADAEEYFVMSYPDADATVASLGGLGSALGGVSGISDSAFVFNENVRALFGEGNLRSIRLPSLFEDTQNENDVNVLGGPRYTAFAHPLLMGRQGGANAGNLPGAAEAASAVSRSHRAGRQRGNYRYVQQGARHPNPPAILQRLLGPTAAQDVLQLTAAQGGGFGRDARVFLIDSGLGLLANPDDETMLDMQDTGNGLLAGAGLPTGLANTPGALVRWLEEALILDAESIHDCVTGVKPDILAVIEKYREEELSQKREERKKQFEEEEAKKKKEQEEKKNKEESNVEGSASAGVEGGNAATAIVGSSASSLATNSETASANGNHGSGDSHMELDQGLFHGFASQAGFSSTPLEGPNTSLLIDLPSGLTIPNQSRRLGGSALSGSSVTNTSSANAGASPGPEMLADFIVGNVMRPAIETATSNVPATSSASPRRSQAQAVAITLTPQATPTVTTDASTLSVSDTPFNPIPALDPNAPRPVQSNTRPSCSITPSQEAFLAQTARLSANFLEMYCNLVESPQQAATESTAQRGANEAAAVEVEEVEVENGAAGGNGDEAGSVAGAEAVTTTTVAISSARGGGNPNAEVLAALGDIEIPEGVDPSFLAALPEDMRQEVIAEQLRLQRLRQRARAQTAEPSQSVLEVNPEFLAALPPNIQEEVLAQQRVEQQRQTAVVNNPNEPMDPADFLQNLPPALRQSILADMEDSQMAVLPPDLAAEAQSLRREWEARNRQMMHERFVNPYASNALSSILRNTVGRLGTRYTLQAVPQRSQWGVWGTRSGQNGAAPAAAAAGKLRGRQLLDQEALSCLIVLLFLDEPKLNTTRLHRVLRNLCYHGPTKDWVIKSLLLVLERCNESKIESSGAGSSPAIAPPLVSEAPGKGKRLAKPEATLTPSPTSKATVPVASAWLNVSLDAALGCRANVFHIHRPAAAVTGKKVADKHTAISIHTQATPIICRHVLDALISLAKSFPSHFLPRPPNSVDSGASDSKEEPKKGGSTKGKDGTGTDFWDVLLRLDSQSASKKGKGLARTHSNVSNNAVEEEARPLTLEGSPFGQLLALLASPVIRRSSLLTDRLLRLLSLISLGLPDQAGPKSPVLTRRGSEAETSGRMRDWVRRERQEAQEANMTITEVTDVEVEGKEKIPATAITDPALWEQHLKLAVDVLTCKSCSEEGLEDATTLLINLSYGPQPTRDTILRLLLEGARELGQVVGGHISSLFGELQHLNKKQSPGSAGPGVEKLVSPGQTSPAEDTDLDSATADRIQRGILHDRFTRDTVVITAPTRPKAGAGYELQLPAMGPLTSKASSQAFFLRILKVILQLRDAARIAQAKNKKRPTDDSTVPSAVPAITESANEAPMEVDVDTTVQVAATIKKASEETTAELPSLSEQLLLDSLWDTLSSCLSELSETPDLHAVLVLQPAVEAFFLVHAASHRDKDSERRARRLETRESQLSHLQEGAEPPSPLPAQGGAGDEETALPGTSTALVTQAVILPPDTHKFLEFAERHRTVLNQILRQSTVHLAEGPFAVLVDHTRVLDFDVKRRYFRTELERADSGLRREDLAVHVRREHVFEDSFRELHRRSAEEWKNRFYIVFEGEEGQDAGGLLREWYVIISREIFNPMYALFCTSPGDRVTYMINSTSHCNSNHLCYFKFVGRVIAKAVYDNKLLECYFTRSFYKHILGKAVRYTDMESEDYSFYQGLVYLMEHHNSELGYDLTFSLEVQEFGVTEVRDLKPNGRNIAVTEENKMEYIRLVCQMKMTGAIRKQLNAFLEGFYDIIPKRLISIFNEQELELLISGLPNIDIEDLKANAEYHKYQANSLQIQWFWRALRSFDQADRAKFLQFVTGTSKVPLQGFAALEGMNGTQKFQIHRDDRSTDRLPSAHTCFNQLDLPAYETYDKLKSYMLKAIHECSEGFGFA